MSGVSGEGALEEEKKLAIRVRCKNGKNCILRDISSKDTVSSLLTKLESLSQIPANQIALLKGFPPKRINFDVTQMIETLGLELQDTLIIELDQELKAEPRPLPPTSDVTRVPIENNAFSESDSLSVDRNSEAHASVMSAEAEGILLRHVVPSDNSCLFSAVIYCLSKMRNFNLQRDSSNPPHVFLRKVIANTVLSDPEQYNEAFLGKPNGEYVKWIQRRDSWGGGIELSILTEYFRVEIDVVDIQSLHISRFGEDKNYSFRIFLIYDGIHYDSLYLDPFNMDYVPEEEKFRTVFSTSDQTVCELALELAKEAKATHQFTDLKNFTLKCTICHELLKGQEGAQAHAKNSGHTSFAETS